MKNDKDIETLYKDNQYIIRMVANTFIHSYPDSQELESIGNFVFKDAVRSWDPRKGSQFKSWLSLLLKSRFINEMRINKDMSSLEVVDPQGDILSDKTRDKYWFEHFIYNISSDALLVVTLVVYDNEIWNSNEGMRQRKRHLRGRLRKYLQDEMGWDWRRVSKAFIEIDRKIEQ